MSVGFLYRYKKPIWAGPIIFIYFLEPAFEPNRPIGFLYWYWFLLYRSDDITANHSITGRQPAQTGIKEPNWNYLFILRMGQICKISPKRPNGSFIPVLVFIPV